MDREYNRTKEAPEHWPVALLADAKEGANKHGAGGAATLLGDLVGAQAADGDGELLQVHPFYDMSQFKLRHQSSVQFPDYVMASTNYFNRAWTGMRRLKNVVMILEWVPSVKAVTPKVLSDAQVATFLQAAAAAAVASIGSSSEDKTKEADQHAVLRKAYKLLSFDGKDCLTAEDVRNAIEMASFTSTSDAALAEVMAAFGTVANAGNGDGGGASGGGVSVLTFPSFRALLESGRIFRRQAGRYWVAVSLAEAETLRRLIHVKQSTGGAVVAGSDVAIALRYSPAASISGDQQSGSGGSGGDGSESTDDKQQSTRAALNKTLDSFCGIVFDGSTLWNETFGAEDKISRRRLAATDASSPSASTTTLALGNPEYQRAVVHACFRFFDNDAHFSKPAVTTLIQTLEGTPPHLRESFFLAAMGCRRRMAIKPSNTALKQIFQIEKAADALKQRAHVSFLRRAIAARGLTLYEAFLAVDANSNGCVRRRRRCCR